MTDTHEGLDSVRRRAVLLFQVILLVVAVAALIAIARGAIAIQMELLRYADELRAALGLAKPAQGPDWYRLALAVVIPVLAALALLLLWTWYRRLWRRRLEAVWDGRAPRVLTRVRPLPDTCLESCAHCESKSRYLQALLATRSWQAHWPQIQALAKVDRPSPGTLAAGDYDSVAGARTRQRATRRRPGGRGPGHVGKRPHTLPANVLR